MEQAQKKKRKKVYVKQISALVFLGLLIIMCLLNIVFGDKRAEKPKLTVKAVLDGGYMEEYGTFFTNRFFGRNGLEGLNASVQTMFGKRKSKGIYKGKGEYLLEEIAAPDEKALEENVRKIQELAGTYYNIPIYFMLVPNAANIQSEKLPSYAVERNQKKQFKSIQEKLGVGINWVEVSKTLEKHSDEEIYYRTDRHWTSLGAFYGYEALASAMGLDTSRAPKPEPYVVNNDFNGSLSGQSGYGKEYKDSVTIYAPKQLKDSVRIVMTNMDTNKKSATLYNSVKLEKKDKYSLFLGGDSGMIDIKTTADTTERLLIFKDSYANCLIPFLTPYYREIVVVDPALYKGNIQEIMQKARFTSILFLYNGNSFVTDTNISGVLGMSIESGLQPQRGADTSSAQEDGTKDASDTQEDGTKDVSGRQKDGTKDSSGTQDEGKGDDESGDEEDGGNSMDSDSIDSDSTDSDSADSDSTDSDSTDGETDDETE